MKVYEVLDSLDAIKVDLKTNRGKAVKALVRGAKKKTNAVPRSEDNIDPDETIAAY